MTITSPIHLDLSELLAAPLRTGIQRIEREAIRHWGGPAPLLPFRIDREGQLLRLPQSVFEVLCAEDDGSPVARETERQSLLELASRGSPIPAKDVKRLLNLELFFSPIRADAHLRLATGGSQILWYIYDFLPFLRPDLFTPGMTRHCMHFLRGLRATTSLAFLSEQTRQDYANRIARVPLTADTGPVILPGADGLQMERQSFTPERRDFVAIGTIEPRKNPQALLGAFESIWNSGANVRLIVAGRMSPEATEAHAFFARYANSPNLVVMEQPADQTLRAVLRQARAVVMPSEAEGFGLPPYEALHAGIPSIASARLPSAALLPGGVRLLERMDAASIAACVVELLDDATAARLWAQAADVQLPTWAEFGRTLADWAQAG
jgi:glycosyltransferase involved in cell wall biosynthesis